MTLLHCVSGSKLDVEALRNRARAEQFPSALQKGDSTIMCVRPGLEISEHEDVTVRPLRLLSLYHMPACKFKTIDSIAFLRPALCEQVLCYPVRNMKFQRSCEAARCPSVL